jgi:hypothetical protein
MAAHAFVIGRIFILFIRTGIWVQELLALTLALAKAMSHAILASICHRLVNLYYAVKWCFRYFKIKLTTRLYAIVPPYATVREQVLYEP